MPEAGQALLQAFSITPDDLEANRNGRLGAAQRRRLLSSGYWNLAGALLIGALLGAIPFISSKRPMVPAQFITAGVLFAVVLAVAVRYFLRIRSAVAANRVDCFAGPVALSSEGRSGFFVTVNEQSFRLPIRPWHVQHDAAYRVYIAAGVIVAMEVM